jgi:hypothetical protein
MKPEDIHIQWRKGNPDQGEYLDTCGAYLKVLSELRVRKESLKEYPKIKEDAEKDCRRHVSRIIYGEITELAREVLNELKMVRWVSFDQQQDLKVLQEKLIEIVNYEKKIGSLPQRSAL